MDINCHTPHLDGFCLPTVSAVTCEVQHTDFLCHLWRGHADIPRKIAIIAILNIN